MNFTILKSFICGFGFHHFFKTEFRLKYDINVNTF